MPWCIILPVNRKLPHLFAPPKLENFQKPNDEQNRSQVAVVSMPFSVILRELNTVAFSKVQSPILLDEMHHSLFSGIEAA